MVKLQMSYDKPGRPHDSVSQFHDLKRFKFVLLDPFRFQLLDRSSESHSLIIIFASESTLWFYWLPVPPLDQLSSLSQHCHSRRVQGQSLTRQPRALGTLHKTRILVLVGPGPPGPAAYPGYPLALGDHTS